jgi:DNA-binding beta-propeller fold protein YncE
MRSPFNKYKWRVVIPLVLLLSFILAPMAAYAEVKYETYTRDNFKHVIWTQPAYFPIGMVGNNLYAPNEKDPGNSKYSPMQNPQDVFIDGKDHIYVADTGNHRIVHFDEQGNWLRYIALPESPFKNPHGVFVTDEGFVYVADTGNKRVVKLDPQGKLLQEFKQPVSRFIPDGYQYDPIKLTVDRRGFIYIVTLGGYQGLLQLSPDGEFSSFYGTNVTTLSIVDKVKRVIYTREMWQNELSKLPGVIRNAAVDDDGFIYTVTSGIDIKNEQVKKLNIEGKNILAQYNKLGKKQKKSYGAIPHYISPADTKSGLLLPTLIDVAVDSNGNMTVIDSNINVISQYDANGNLLFYWGGYFGTGTTQLGLVKTPVALDINSRNELFILDNQETVLHRFQLTEFGQKVHEANALTMDGYYRESEQLWDEVLRLNAYYSPAIDGLGMAAYKNQQYEKAAGMFLRSGNQKGYSDAFWQIRLLWFQRNFSWIATSLILLFLAFMSFDWLTRKAAWRSKWNNRKKTKGALAAQLKQALYILKHPLDGFTDLRHENKGSYLSAFVILLGTYIALIITESYTSFTFNFQAPFQVNALNTFISFFAVWMCWVICNYLISSIYNGEGRFKDVFIGSAYALVPLIIVGIPLALVSNVMTASEEAIYDYLYYGMMVWVGALFFWKVQALQNYSVGETVYNIFLSLFSMVILSVLVFITVGLTNELRIFIYEVYQEVSMR